MITPKCDKCGKELEEYGALAISPPKTNLDGSCGRNTQKYHICPKCWALLLKWFKSPEQQ